MGVLPEREWILRAPTLQAQAGADGQGPGRGGHAQLLYRVAEDLGKPREQMFADLLAGKTKFHNVFHYPTSRGATWASSPGSWTPRRSSPSRRCATRPTGRTRGR